MTQNWRVGNKVPINIYAGDRPVCQCHCERDAERIVSAVNSATIVVKRSFWLTEFAIGFLAGALVCEMLRFLVR